MFDFQEFTDLRDNEIKLVKKSHDMPVSESGDVPRYGFSIVLLENGEDIGVIYFAVDRTRRQFLRGHLSYGVSPAHAGHNYAMKACRLIAPVALAHGFDRLFIGADRDNIASRKTIEKLGAQPVTIHDVPDGAVIESLRADGIDMYVWRILE